MEKIYYECLLTMEAGIATRNTGSLFIWLGHFFICGRYQIQQWSVTIVLRKDGNFNCMLIEVTESSVSMETVELVTPSLGLEVACSYKENPNESSLAHCRFTFSFLCFSARVFSCVYSPSVLYILYIFRYLGEERMRVYPGILCCHLCPQFAGPGCLLNSSAKSSCSSRLISPSGDWGKVLAKL